MSGRPTDQPLLAQIARGLRSPFVPEVFGRLASCEGYLDVCWPQLEPSVETEGFLGSALYVTDMALDPITEAYEPTISPAMLRERGIDDATLDELRGVLDVFHWVQPQTLLLCAALAEALAMPRVGGQGRPEPRTTREREARHLLTDVRFAPAAQPLLRSIAESLHMDEAPQLYQAVACWPAYLEAAWEELQHLAAYPLQRRRARALYYYARSSARFLAYPVELSAEALVAGGVTTSAVAAAGETLQAALPVLATMVVHCTAMRFALGERGHEVVRPTEGTASG